MKKSRLLVAVCVSILTFSHNLTHAVTLPTLSTFDSDVLGLRPAVGGPDQPSLLRGGGSALVQASDLGINTQPVVLTSDSGDFITAVWNFDPVTTASVRLEATVSAVGGFFNSNTLFLSDSSGAAALSMNLNGIGDITLLGTTDIVGSYSDSTPFRARIDAIPVTLTSSITIDNELNGFDDDPVFSDIPFFQGNFVDDIGQIGIQVNPAPGQSGHVAFDDVLVQVIPIPPALYLFGSGLLGLLGITRRNK
jgi:hypothetical protein